MLPICILMSLFAWMTLTNAYLLWIASSIILGIAGLTLILRRNGNYNVQSTVIFVVSVLVSFPSWCTVR